MAPSLVGMHNFEVEEAGIQETSPKARQEFAGIQEQDSDEEEVEEEDEDSPEEQGESQAYEEGDVEKALRNRSSTKRDSAFKISESSKE